jgi:DNA-binding Xre family transcriptional regulator
LGAGGEPAPRWTATRPTSNLRSVALLTESVVILLQWSRGACRTFHNFGRPRIPGGDERAMPVAIKPNAKVHKASDKKIGAVIRIRRVKLGLSQTDLGDALGVSFQQIQKYERGTNSVASTRISDLCRALEMTPNDLFDVSSKMDGDVPKLSSWTMKTSPAMRQAIDAMLHAGPKRRV